MCISRIYKSIWLEENSIIAVALEPLKKLELHPCTQQLEGCFEQDN